MYGTLADFRTWHQLRGNAAPTDATDADATAALVRASDYIAAHYVVRFASEHKDPLPGVVEQAAYIAAGFELGKPGFFSATYVAGQEKVLTQVGSIRWEVVQSGKASYAVPRSTDIEALLAPYVAAKGIGVVVV